MKYGWPVYLLSAAAAFGLWCLLGPHRPDMSSFDAGGQAVEAAKVLLLTYTASLSTRSLTVFLLLAAGSVWCLFAV